MVRLQVPATGEHLRLARLVVAAVASRYDASLEDIEDLRLAVGEVCAHLVAVGGPRARLTLAVSVEQGMLTVDAGVPVDGTTAPVGPPDRLVDTVLATVTDDHDAEDTDGAAVMRFRRRIAAGRRV